MGEVAGSSPVSVTGTAPVPTVVPTAKFAAIRHASCALIAGGVEAVLARRFGLRAVSI
jgi:hypothetical protein